MSSSSLLIFPYKKLLIVFFNLLIHWQSGCDFKFLSTAQSVGNLSDAEVNSVNTVVGRLQPAKQPNTITKSYCTKSNTASNNGLTLNCTDQCNKGASCHISVIDFSSAGLSGTIDELIGDLTELTKLDLSDNKLHGPIPTSLGTLSKLRSLDLSKNQLTGPIPDSVLSLSSLLLLDLSNNQLTGKIPDNLGYLPSLQILYLYKNFLTGTIPSSLGGTSLEELSLEYNMLSESIPIELGQLHNLTYLCLSDNQLGGKLPEELGKLTKLTVFVVSANYFSGDLPKSYENLTNLEMFDIAGNELQGPLPDVSKWATIKILSLQGNNFEGPLPNGYFEMSNLQELYISDLSGTGETKFPPVKFFQITTLVLRRCSLSGPIPESVGELPELLYLDLSFNKLTGGIPDSLNPNLIYLSLSRNNLNGTIPNWMIHASGTRMDLSYNEFNNPGTPVPPDTYMNLFSCCLGVSQDVTEPYMLQLNNMTEHFFPKGKSKFHNLYINSGGEQTSHSGGEQTSLFEADNSTSTFYISPKNYNWAYSFSGDFLSEATNSSDYTKRIPCGISDDEPSLDSDARLSPVSLDYYGFNLHEGLYNVTLYFAEIVYSENEDYSILKKRFFDIYIQGELKLPNFSITDHAEGPKKKTNLNFRAEVNESSLLHIQLYWAGKGTSTYYSEPVLNGPLVSAIAVYPLFKDGLSPWKIALITLASLVLALLLLLALAWSMGWLGNKELKKKVKVGEHVSSENAKEDINVTLKQLVRATGNFSDEKKLGSGYLGAVYKADVMESPKITVAVKKLFPRHKGKIYGPIKKEIFVLKSLESENLVKLLDVHIGESLQLLIYEYMEKESLETALFNSKVGTFPWKTRLEICKGIAMGLDSLHQYSIKIVHGNLKASNILLGKNDKPKLSDFGYAGIYNEEDKFSIIKQGASRGIFAPEYCDEATVKTDIYSFGVVLLEIVAGRGNKEKKGNQETTDLVDKVHFHFKAKNPNISGFIDKKLEGDRDLNEREVELVLRLAVRCTSCQSLRPWISDVLSVLNGEKNVDDI